MAGQYADFKCKDCDNHWTFKKHERHHIFPTHPPCEKCGSKNTVRNWSTSNIAIKVKKGKMGNAADGYTGTSGTAWDKNVKDARKTLKKLGNTKNTTFQ